MRTLNPRLFIIQFVVSLLFWLGFKQLYFLFDFNLVEFISTMGTARFSALTTDNYAIGERLKNLHWIKVVLSYTAILITYIINAYINHKTHASWLYSFAIALLLVVFQLLNVLDLPTHWFLFAGIKFSILFPIVLCLGVSSAFFYRWLGKLSK